MFISGSLKILLIQLRQIGDVLMTTPALRALRETYPQAELHFLTEAGGGQVLTNNPHLNRIWTIPRTNSFLAWLGIVSELRRMRYTTVIDCFGNPRSAWLTRLSGAPQRIGFARRGRSWVYTDVLPYSQALTESERYSAIQKARLFAPLGVSCARFKLELFTKPTPELDWPPESALRAQLAAAKWIVVCAPVSRRAYKRWPLERFALIADYLVQQHQATVVLLHGPDQQECDAAQTVQSLMKTEALRSEHVPCLQVLARFMRQAALYVGNDNGLRHIAISQGMPTITPFGKPAAADWTPPHDPQHRTVEVDVPCKAHCVYPRCEHVSCITAVTAEAVQAELEVLLPSVVSRYNVHQTRSHSSP